jgi:hypothetical protein
LHALDLDLPTALLKGQKTIKTTTQQSNGGVERVGQWENGQLLKM